MPSNKSLIKKPLISEKGTDLARLDKYIFLAYPKANKKQLKEAIEDIYNVHVVQVNIVRNKNRSHGYKKAVITLRKGETIDTVPH
ncbi:MAG: 50S ribosomal protein L23 [Candidatus Colwellbacteria bacterium RBG_13_48_8]|uniref:Large ribosomal subunit protein uL23 n=1 Tax=Candidatus Colwellbacteria bacterium RBG_13_48_8 TaxID=1797685 RepID=A0A1G1YY11_9BACT|nr:MAG: 50S ribosomal protein L23 [Candidatus Colwellbacteria bacterium RBG_13_48_8]